MKEHSHCNTLYEMFKARQVVMIKDLRGWCNYRSRISDIRPRFESEGLSIVPCIVEGQHAYKLVAKEPVVVPVIKTSQQLEFALGRG